MSIPSPLHPPLPVHTYFLTPSLVGDTGWPTLTIGTPVDPSLAPHPSDAPSGDAGYTSHVLHCYMAEPFEPWRGLEREGGEYETLKGCRAEVLWGLVEQVRGWWVAGWI